MLVAELFTALAMIFLVATTVGHVTIQPHPTPTPTPTPTPLLLNCGLSTQYVLYTFTIPSPDNLRAQSAAAVSAFEGQVKARFANETRVAGLVEAYGGGATIADGKNLADGAITGLRSYGHLFTSGRTIYQAFFDTTAPHNEVYLLVFYYVTASVCV